MASIVLMVGLTLFCASECGMRAVTLGAALMASWFQGDAKE
jgi:hypothetical protein